MDISSKNNCETENLSNEFFFQDLKLALASLHDANLPLIYKEGSLELEIIPASDSFVLNRKEGTLSELKNILNSGTLETAKQFIAALNEVIPKVCDRLREEIHSMKQSLLTYYSYQNKSNKELDVLKKEVAVPGNDDVVMLAAYSKIRTAYVQLCEKVLQEINQATREAGIIKDFPEHVHVNTKNPEKGKEYSLTKFNFFLDHKGLGINIVRWPVSFIYVGELLRVDHDSPSLISTDKKYLNESTKISLNPGEVNNAILMQILTDWPEIGKVIDSQGGLNAFKLQK